MVKTATAPSGAVAKADELQVAKNNIYKVLNDERTLQAIRAALPEMGVTPERVASIAFSVIAGKQSLLECDAKSLIKVIIEGALLGLSFDPHLKQAAIVPFAKQATLIVEYMGLVKLARNSGVLKYVSAEIVHENDQFDYMLGLDPDLQHTPPKKGERGKPIGAYAVGTLMDGDKVFKYLTEAEINFYREKSRAKDAADSPWNTDPMAMWRKTAIRRLVGYLPMDDKTARASAIDEMAETGHDQVLAPEIFGAIDVTAVETKSKTEEQKEKLKAAKEQQPAASEQPPAVDHPARQTQWTQTFHVLEASGIVNNEAQADVLVSEATGGKIQSLKALKENGTIDQMKQVETHVRILSNERKPAEAAAMATK